jgi:hypothetical protein
MKLRHVGFEVGGPSRFKTFCRRSRRPQSLAGDFAHPGGEKWLRLFENWIIANPDGLDRHHREREPGRRSWWWWLVVVVGSRGKKEDRGVEEEVVVVDVVVDVVGGDDRIWKTAISDGGSRREGLHRGRGPEFRRLKSMRNWLKRAHLQNAPAREVGTVPSLARRADVSRPPQRRVGRFVCDRCSATSSGECPAMSLRRLAQSSRESATPLALESATLRTGVHRRPAR